MSDTSASGKTISIKSTNPQAGTTVGSAPLSGATATVPISLQSGAHTLSAAGTDNACGTGDGNAISGGATLSFTVDTAAPTCYITRPSAGYLKCTDNESPPGGCTDAGQSMSYTVQSTVTGAENGQIVYVRDDGGVIGSGAMTGGAAPNIPVVLAQGNSALTIQVTDLSGNTCTSTPVNVTIDTVGPAFAVTGPASPTSDVDLTAPGIQSDVVFSASSIETGRTISIRSSTNGGTTYSAVGSKVFDGGSPDVLRVNLSAGPNKLVAYGCDTIGNCTTSAVYDLTVTGSGPTVSFVKPTGSTPNNCNPEIAQPLVYGGTGCGTVDGGTIAVSVKVSSSYTSCSDNCVTLYKDGGAIATGNLSGGAVTFAGIGALTLNDAEIGTFQARVVDSTADAGYSAFLNWSVDVSAPGNPVFDSPVCTSQPVTLNKYSDVSSGTAGLQYVFKFQTPGIEDGQTLTLTGSTQGVVGTGTVVSTYVTMPLLTVSEGSQTLTASVTDLVGNPASVQCQVNVDVTAPTDVQLDASVNRRAGTVALAWTYPGDNGMSGTAQSFDIKVSSRMAVGSLCPFVVEDAGVIDGGASISGFPKAPPLAGGTPTDASVTGLILESTYCFATEAADTAGNRSTSAPIQVVSVNTQLREDRVYGPLTDPGSLGMGQRMATGDFNGDGYTDIAFNQNPTVDASVFIVWGNDGGMQTLTAPLWVDPTLTKFGQSIANAGDMDGDGFDDLLIATNNTTAGVGATRTAFLYYGSDAGLVYGPNGTAIAGSPVRFDLNPQLSETAYARTLFVRPLGDVTGDGVPDVLFVESKAKDGGFSGQASLWLGPSRSPHDAGDCGGNPSLPECKRPPMPSPGVVARIGPSGMITINGTDTSATVCGTPGAPNVSEIGSFLGAGAIGDVNGDGIQDFFIRSASLSGGAADAGRGWVFLGKSSFSSMVGTTITLNQADVRIEAPYAATWGNVPNFAQSIAGLGRVSGSSGAACSPTPCDDFAIGADARIYIVYGRNTWPSELCLSDTHQPLLLLAGSESDAGSVGQSLAGVGDVTGDGRVDLLAGGNAGGAFFYYGTGDGGVPFGVVNGGKPDVTMVFPVGSLIGTWVMKVTSWDNDPFGDFMISTTASSGSFFVKY
ncbi:MAG: FG-GAP repeat protein [Deltaproteobacteria bacterium]|nr:FG-GAP repeat protein [Deltaproteobacteria bacterium]